MWILIVGLGFTSILWWTVRWWIIHKRACRVVVEKRSDVNYRV